MMLEVNKKKTGLVQDMHVSFSAELISSTESLFLIFTSDNKQKNQTVLIFFIQFVRELIYQIHSLN